MTRRNTPRISFIGFGEAGQAIASGLRETGIERIAAWDILFPQQTGAKLKEAAETSGRAHGVVGRATLSAKRTSSYRRSPRLRAWTPHVRPRHISTGNPYYLDINSGIARPQTGDGRALRRSCPLRRCRPS